MQVAYNFDFEIVALFVIIILDIYSVTRYSMDTKQKKSFAYLEFSATLGIIIELVWFFVQKINAPSILCLTFRALTHFTEFLFLFFVVLYLDSYIDDEKHRKISFNYYNRLLLIICSILLFLYIVMRFTMSTWEEHLFHVEIKYHILSLIIIAFFFAESVYIILRFKTYFTKKQVIVYLLMICLSLFSTMLQKVLLPTHRIVYFYAVIVLFVVLILVETPEEEELNNVLENLDKINESLEKKVDEENKRLTELDEKEVRLIKQLMFVMSRAIDAKDKYTCGHSVRVAKYSKMLAKKLGMDKDAQEQVFTIGILHDLGKVAVPNKIINKPGKLTDEEFNVMRSHPSVGYDILSKIKTLPNIADGARWHHERIDGHGYPDHLAGDEIPYISKIICVADAYDAMTSYRSYRGVMAQDKVREQIVEGLGTQFDEEIGKKMIEIIDEDVNYTLHEEVDERDAKEVAS